jgi:hypothetical protein
MPRSLLVFTLTLAMAALAQAQRYGAEIQLGLTGSIYLEADPTVVTRPNGDIVETARRETIRVTSRSVLAELETRSLIPAGSVTNYRLVLAGDFHHSTGSNMGVYARPITGTSLPVPVPTDIFELQVQPGPIAGAAVANGSGALLRLSRVSRNFATLSFGGLEGTGVIKQTWTLGTAGAGAALERVELVTASGQFNGPVERGGRMGVGVVELSLSKPRIIELSTYGRTGSGSGGLASGGTTSGATLDILGPNFSFPLTLGAINETVPFDLGNLQIGDTTSVLLNK